MDPMGYPNKVVTTQKGKKRLLHLEIDDPFWSSVRVRFSKIPVGWEIFRWIQPWNFMGVEQLWISAPSWLGGAFIFFWCSSSFGEDEPILTFIWFIFFKGVGKQPPTSWEFREKIRVGQVLGGAFVWFTLYYQWSSSIFWQSWWTTFPSPLGGSSQDL